MPQSDSFASFRSGLESPATRHFSITPQDGSELPQRPRLIYVLQGGSLVLRDEAGTLLTYTVTSGQMLPIRAVNVEQTGTTAVTAGWF